MRFKEYNNLVKGRLNRRELRVEVAADALHGGDGGNGNESSNQAVFDSGCALVVLQHLTNVHLTLSVVNPQRSRTHGLSNA